MITYYIYVVYTLGFCSCLFWHDMRIKLWPCFFCLGHQAGADNELAKAVEAAAACKVEPATKKRRGLKPFRWCVHIYIYIERL